MYTCVYLQSSNVHIFSFNAMLLWLTKGSPWHPHAHCILVGIYSQLNPLGCVKDCGCNMLVVV